MPACQSILYFSCRSAPPVPLTAWFKDYSVTVPCNLAAAAALILTSCPPANAPQDYNVTVPHPDAVPLERSILVPEVGWRGERG